MDDSNSRLREQNPDETRPMPPLFKWAGGKRFLTSQLVDLVPSRYGRYFEPFLGGAALFFALQPARAVLSDLNEDLIEAYSAVRDLPRDVIRILNRWPNSEAHYYKIRDSRPRTSAARAARFMYLTTLSFNGIYRVNRKGQFNVPYGFKDHISPCSSDRILAASAALAHSDLMPADFQTATACARKGDLIYFDPPYTVAHSNNGFVKYNAKIFSWADQVRLARLSGDLRNRGCAVIVSNADHPSIRTLYPDFNVTTVERFSIMAAQSLNRKRITECIFYT